MTDPAALPPETPDPLHGHQPIPPGLKDAPANPLLTPPVSTDSSPLGSAKQYHHAPSIPSLHNQVSITGATKDDPTATLAREAVLYDPEWASPAVGFWTVLVRGYIFSFLIYWFGYGFFLMLSLGIAEVLFGQVRYLTPNVLGSALTTGPLAGYMLDCSILNTHSAISFTGGIFLLSEPLLAILILITHEWRGRLRYGALMFGLVLAKAVVYVLVNSAV